jgi:cytosine/adenosine deaminase-related metal-dependent hydrolase
MHRRWCLTFLFSAVAVALVSTQPQTQPQFSDTVRGFIKVDAPVVALTNVRVIDGTGAPARAGQTIIIKGGRIAEVGDAARVPAPEGATVLDLAGRTVLPGLVMVHEHLYYPTGPGVYGQLGESFIRLYLAGGVTTMRTAGNMNGFMDLKLKTLIDSGQRAGPAIDATAPYLNGPNTFAQLRDLKGPDDARRQVAYWADEGATSFKAYMNIRRDELGAAIEEIHKRGLKITGHLCSVTYAEAADLGIDNLEHGFLAATSSPTSSPTSAPDRPAASRPWRRSTSMANRSGTWSRNSSTGMSR